MGFSCRKRNNVFSFFFLYFPYSLATASGNTGKKILLEVPNRGNNVTTSARRMEVGVVSRTPGSNRNQTKRNLMTQLNSPTDFAKPIGSAKSFRKPVKVMATLGVPTLSLPRRRVSFHIGLFVVYLILISI